MKNKRMKTILTLSMLALLLTVTVSGTLAYLSTSTPEVKNTFLPTAVDCVVVETVENNTKSNVKIKVKEYTTDDPTNYVDAYIRAAVIATWQHKDGTIFGVLPEAGEDYSITYPDNTGWTKNGDFYYYESAVAPGAETGVLFTNCTPLKPAPAEGYTLHVEIVAQAIQKDGDVVNGPADWSNLLEDTE